MTIKEEIEELLKRPKDNCITCGGPAKIVGSVTMNYEPYILRLEKIARAAVGLVEALNNIGWCVCKEIPCICSDEVNAENALKKFEQAIKS